MTIAAALLDENGIYLRMDYLEDMTQLTERHLPTITSCDLPPGKYKWIWQEQNNPYGGYFEDVGWRSRVDETRLKAEQESPVSRRSRRR